MYVWLGERAVVYNTTVGIVWVYGHFTVLLVLIGLTSVMYGSGERLKEGRSSVRARGLSRGVMTPVSHI